MNILDSKTYINDLNYAIKNLNAEKLYGKSVLVTGGLGLIGSAVVDLLVHLNLKNNANISIYIAARNQNAFNVRYGQYKFIEFVNYDATLPINFCFKLDYIIHCAGLASPELYTTSPVETILSNFNGIYNLLEFSKQNSIERLLYVSSSEVYGIKDNDNSFVESIYGNINLDSIRSSYPVAKRASEMLCKAYSSEYNIDTVIVRPGHIYGPTASPNDKRISSDFPYKAARGQNLEMKSAGLQKRSYCYCVDCAIAILIVLLNGQSGEAYNIGHNDVTTIRQMAEIVANAGGVKLTAVEPTQQEMCAFNPMNNSSLNNEKIKALGYCDNFNVQEGLSHTVQILKEIL